MNDRLVRACRREPVDATPVWFMRQAGRSFAAYRALRERYGILELAKTPDLCAEVTLMPVRELGVDGAVLFADIMLPLEPMGVGLRIEPDVGPIIDRPIRSAADVAALRPFDPAGVAFTLDAIRLVRRELDGNAGVIGFSGAPYTLACYLVEGRPSRDFATAKAFMFREPAAWHDLMERLSTMVVLYLRAQVDAGADVVQLFDSWVGGLGPADYREFVQPHVRRIFDALRDVPTIHFGTGTAALLEDLAEAGGDVIGLDHRVSLADAWRRVGDDRGVQGNLDSARLLAGWDATRAGALAVLEAASGRPGHIFNLGHGVLPETDTDLLRRLVELVHLETARAGADVGGRVTGVGRPGALLMTYGSPASLGREDVRSYLARVRGGREPDAELVDEFTRRYEVIGGSPLIEITRRQAKALSEALGWPVKVGMRFSEPSIEAGLRTLSAAGVTSVAAIILSPQYSPLLMRGYGLAIDEAVATMGEAAPRAIVAGAWHLEPSFVVALARRTADALDQQAVEGRAPHVLMTAHSLPRRVADQEPGYLAQLRATADAIAERAGLTDRDWTFCWQSAGHEPGEWMQPDFADLMPEIARSGGRSVVVVPVQFLADHLETLYDVDIGARDQAEGSGLAFHRIDALNMDPGLIDALAAVARRTLEGVAESSPVLPVAR